MQGETGMICRNQQEELFVNGGKEEVFNNVSTESFGVQTKGRLDGFLVIALGKVGWDDMMSFASWSVRGAGYVSAWLLLLVAWWDVFFEVALYLVGMALFFAYVDTMFETEAAGAEDPPSRWVLRVTQEGPKGTRRAIWNQGTIMTV
jgi:hypothetical protein